MRPVGERIGLGVGLDLPWQGPYGIVGDQVSDRTVRFLQQHAHRFGSLFVSWQPRDKGVPDAAVVTGAWDALFDAVDIEVRTLHQTALNLAGAHYDRSAVIAVTNALIERYGFRWVNEDLGSWSVRGRPLPYPQPPPLTHAGVAFCVARCAEVDRALDAPLVVEFPGFETPPPFRYGALDAYDAFRDIVEGADVSCTLDTGHLLSWRWALGHRGEALLDDLDRLPLDRCIELHCAGAAQVGEALVDAHHGIVMDAQLVLASRLMARCPNLRVVTYEDPRFDERGVLPAAAGLSLDALEARVEVWLSTPDRTQPPDEVAPIRISAAHHEGAPWEDALLERTQQQDAFGRRCRRQVLTRQARGLGTLLDLYPRAIRAWRAAHPDDTDLDTLVRAFLQSPHGRAWSEYAWAVPGRCIEDAFGRFLVPESDEHLLACARALVVHPRPSFRIPEPFERAPAGWFAIGGDRPPILYAALDDRLVSGPITASLAALLRDEQPLHDEAALARLRELGLIAAHRRSQPSESKGTGQLVGRRQPGRVDR